jgi:hypothetical protein
LTWIPSYWLGPWGCFNCDEAMVKIHRMRMTTHLELPKFCSHFQASSTAAVMNES